MIFRPTGDCATWPRAIPCTTPSVTTRDRYGHCLQAGPRSRSIVPGHALSGYAHLMQNADQTTTQDLGAVTELLSGAFFQPFGRSTSHQLWSSAMVITPALRGMFGVDVDGLSGSIYLDPHLPADWDAADVQRLHVGESVCSLGYQRQGHDLIVKVKTISGSPVRLATAVKEHELRWMERRSPLRCRHLKSLFRMPCRCPARARRR